ncbi:cytochrome P450 [Podospora australis]|uniref:Cytochrome P450 n=1 Tax=Podospora australis TaxID=1536484 RepID=A0AAN7AG95_9PEZI|nr:cytochrome P450 [Podospora australis]
MSLEVLPLSFLLFPFVTFILWELKSWYRLKHIPGPFWNSITVLPLARLAGTGRISFELTEKQKKYGPLMRIAPNWVMFGDADTYRQVNGARSEFFKGDWYAPGKNAEVDSLFTSRDEVVRKELKAKLTPGYARRDDFEPQIDRILGSFIDLIERKHISTPTEFRPIELGHAIQYLTLDIISELSLGEPLGFIASESDMYQFIEINDTFFPILSVLLTMPWLDKVLKSWPLHRLLPKEGDLVGFGRMMGLARTCVEKHLDPDAEPKNDMMASHARNGLSKRELEANFTLELIAGSDSTATAIRITLLCLLATPVSLQKLREEIDQGIASGRINPSGIIADAEAQQLPYLQAVIKEGLRMYPPSTGMNNKEVPPGGATIHGYFLPAGTQVAVNTLYMMRDKKTFGPDADIFRPERWLEAQAVKEGDHRYREMSSVLDLAFGHGRYQCLGKTIAAMELNKTFVELLSRYDFSLVTPHAPMRLFDAAFWMIADYHVVVRHRERA